MKKVYFLLFMMVVFLVTGCRGKADEQTPTVVPSSQTTEVATDLTPTETTDLSSAFTTSAGSINEETIATVTLLTETGDLARQYHLTEYEFHDIGLDEWVEEHQTIEQSWLALARVVLPPYHPYGGLSGKYFAPLWVLLGTEDLQAMTVAWQETSVDEVIGTASLFRTVSLPLNSNLKDLLDARNDWYLPELQGVLWVDRLLLKTDDNGWQLNVFSTETTDIVSNIPYSFSCDTSMQICIQQNQFEIDTDTQQIVYLLVDESLDDIQRDFGFLNTYSLKLEDGRTIHCTDPETAACFKVLYPSMQCDLDKHTCAYQNQIGGEIHAFSLVNNDDEWLADDFREYIRAEFLSDHTPIPTAFRHLSLACNWDELQCYSQEVDCQFNDQRRLTTCSLFPLGQWPESVEAKIVSASESLDWADNDVTTHYLNSVNPQYILDCNWQLQECSENPTWHNDNIDNGSLTSIEMGYSADCDALTQSCVIRNISTDERIKFNFISEPVHWDFFEKHEAFVSVGIKNHDFYTIPFSDLRCDFEQRVCMVFDLTNLGGGGAAESQRCFRLNCPNSALCTTAQYTKYQCFLYRTPRPQR